MLRRKTITKQLQSGFTLVELIIVMVLALTISTAFYTFFKTNFFTYLGLQKDASNFTDLATQSQRIATVVRSLTDISSAAASDLVIYAYFYPTDTYVSLVHYYQNSDATILYADVTPMTSNPPTGSPITTKKRTYTIISNFRQSSGVPLFEYLDSTGDPIVLPIADLHTVKGIRVNLATDTASGNTNQAVTLEVSLRNRKTNL